MRINNEEIGKRIRKERERLSITREQLVEKAEISVQFLADIETGRKSMTSKTICSLANAMNLSTDYILFGRKEKTTLSKIDIMMEKLTPEERGFAENILFNYIAALERAKKN